MHQLHNTWRQQGKASDGRSTELERGYGVCEGVRLSSALLPTTNLTRSPDRMPSAHLDTVNVRFDVAPMFQVQYMDGG